jgi:uncharacterized protein (UPF0276 family)
MSFDASAIDAAPVHSRGVVTNRLARRDRCVTNRPHSRRVGARPTAEEDGVMADASPQGMSRPGRIPVRAGVGLRAPHYREMLASLPDIGWLEVHSENYFGAGGQPLHFLERLRAAYPLSLHGVGLSLGSADGLDDDHLEQLGALVRRFEPDLVSDHLCWGRVGGRHLNDLLPLSYTEEALALVCRHVGQVQDRLGRQILVENVSSYLQYRHSTIPEWEFVAEVARASGCAILLDVNNVHVSAVNHGFDALRYIEAMPPAAVAEIHLAGFDRSEGLLIDSHGRAVDSAVWALYGRAIERLGPKPTLIEWDTDIPPLEVLLDQMRIADRWLRQAHALAA